MLAFDNFIFAHLLMTQHSARSEKFLNYHYKITATAQMSGNRELHTLLHTALDKFATLASQSIVYLCSRPSRTFSKNLKIPEIPEIIRVFRFFAYCF